jgi:hypothetical protein
MKRQQRSERSEQMTKGKTKDEIKGAKTQIKNTAQKRLDTYKGNTYGKIQ